MSKKLIYLIVLVFGLAMTNMAKGADPDLLLWWKFDETSGTIAHDSSGNGHDGILSGDPKWVPGQINGALEFGGDGDYVIDDDAGAYMNGLSTLSVALWIKSDVVGTDSGFIIFETPTSGQDKKNIRYDQDMGGGRLNGIKYGATTGANVREEDESPANVQTTEWQHICVTWQSGSGSYPAGLKLYINGVLTTPSDDDGDGAGATTSAYDRVQVGKGCKDGGATEGWDGLVDDVRIYSRVLTEAEIQQVMLGIPPGSASDPTPAHEMTDVSRDVVLGWTPGEFAAPTNGHKVYFGQSFNDVNDATGAVAQTAASYTPAQRLDFGKIYYWRVDEVNAPPTSHIEFKGDVWSFTTEPIAYPIQNIIATASSSSAGRGPENTVNGSGLDDSGLFHGKDGDDTMWLSDATGPQPSWIEYEFDNVYKLHEMWVWNYNEFMEPVLGLGFKDVTIEYSVNGTDYTPLGTTAEFARAPGVPDYAHNTTIDMGGAAAKYVRLTVNSNWGGILAQYGLSEVRFFYIPVQARKPYPDSGTTDVDVDVVLGFRAGREAATHDVYISTDGQAVIDGTAPATTVTETGYGPLSLDLGKTYYWKINEVNMAETPTMLEGNLWNFTTREFLIVDDIESYNDLNPEEPESNRIFFTWIDGYDIPTNGSLVGYDMPPFAEQSIVHSDKQSMPLFYDNSGTARYSEAELTLSPAQDWTKHGVKALSLWFQGDPNNAAEQMYVKVNGSKVVYDGDAADIRQASWQEWNIDLALFGTNLRNVTKISIGLGDEAGTAPGGSGKMLFDDIRLYPSRCMPSLRKPQGDINNDCVVDCLDLEVMAENWLVAAEIPGNAGLVGHWEFEGNANDSSGNSNHGTEQGTPVYDPAGKFGQAINLDGTDDYVELPTGLVGSDIGSVTLWIKTTQSSRAHMFYGGVETNDNGWGGDDELHVSMEEGEDGRPGGRISFFIEGAPDMEIETAPVNNDTWTHVAATWDKSSSAKLYVNGFMAGSAVHTGNSFSLTGCLRLGRPGDPERYYSGLLDDVRIYNYALSAAEMMYLAGSPVDLNQDNKIAFKDFTVLAEAWLDELLWPQP